MSVALLELPQPSRPRMVDVSKLDGAEKVTIEVITPHDAQMYLDKYNDSNFRRLMPTTVANYKRAILDGNFPLSNSMIIFCTDRATKKVMLGDGQHRLQACVDSGIPIRQVVLRGADPAIIMHADRGKGRQFSDYLAWMGYDHAKVLSMTLKVFHTYKVNVDRIFRPNATDDELYALVNNRPDIPLAVEWAVQHSWRGRPIRMTSSWLAVARTLINEVAGLPTCKDPDEARRNADFFFARLIDGGRGEDGIRSEIPGLNHPIAQLLDVLNDHGSRARESERLPGPVLLAYVIKAWNRYREGDHTKKLIVKLGGDHPEAFPTPI